MLENLINLDKDITLLINSLNTPFTDKFWLTMSDKYIWFPFYALILALIFWRLGWKKGITATITIALTILCVDQTANLVKDVLVQRLRPCNDPSMIERGLHILQKASTRSCYGFFSAHSANSFAFAMASSMILKMDKRRKWNIYTAVAFIWASLVGISRVFVAKHFLGDVLAGAFVGCLLAWVITSVIFKIHQLFSRC